MLVLKSVPLFMVVALAFLPGIAGAASVDVQSGNARVVIGREGQVYIRNQRVGRDVYSDSDYDDDDLDRVIPLPTPYSNRLYRRGYYRDRYYGGSRYYRGKCKGHTYSYSRSGSSTYSSTTVCH
jgi:hypothetical protein